MINIKTYSKRKNNAGSSGGSVSVSTTSNASSTTNSSVNNDWFYYNSDYNSVCCRYNFYSTGSVSANGLIPEEDNTIIIDNLTSTYTDKALSANQGRVLKNLIDNIQTTSGGGGGVSYTVSWDNVTDKPSYFTPTSHTHSISDITSLQNNLNSISSVANSASSSISSHINNSTVHLSQSQINKLNTLTQSQFNKLANLLDMINVDTTNDIITVNGSIMTTYDVTANI